MQGFWKVIAGRENRYIKDFEATKCIAIGWQELADLSLVESEEKLRALYEQHFPDESPAKRAIGLATVAKFRFAMKRGDTVISYDPGARQYLRGEITGDYAYKPRAVCEHWRLHQGCRV